MKKTFLCLFVLSVVRIVFPQTFSQKIREDGQVGQITEVQALYLKALRVMAPEKLPEEYRRLPGPPMKSGFGLFARIRSRWEEFSPEQRVVLESFFYRPELPDSLISPSGLFKIHYTTTGWDAVPTEDVDGSGIPDYVEEVAASMDSVYAIEVGEIGFNPPPDDMGEDGPEWDVYIGNIGAYGITWLEQQVPENPKAWISYMEIDNDFQGNFYTTGIEAVHVTVAHEFFHMIQLGYNFRDGDIFLMETGSTWMEDVVYDDVNDYYQYLGIQYSQTTLGFFDKTNLSFDYSDGWREYGLCVWFHFLEGRTGGREIVREVWEQIIDYPAIEALDMALQRIGRTFDEELAIFYGWNYMTGSRADRSRFYTEGEAYPELNPDGSYLFQEDMTITGEVNPTGSKYFHFYQNYGTSYTLIPTNLNRDSSASAGEFTLFLVRGGDNPQTSFIAFDGTPPELELYTDLDGGVRARLMAEDYLRWKCVAVVESPGQGKDLPASCPNPFVIRDHTQTKILFALDESGLVKIMIAGASGYRVKEDEQYYDSGLRYYSWDGRDDREEQVPSGIYVYVVTSGNKLIRRDKLAVVR